MLDKLTFKFGAAKGLSALEVEVTPVTIFVGPNNSGKSRALIEIEGFCRRMNGQPNDVILADAEFTPLSKGEIEEELVGLTQTPALGETVQPGHLIIGKINPQNNQAFRGQVSREHIVKEAQHPRKGSGHYSQFMNIFTLRLDGTNRLALLKEQNGGDLQTTPANHLAHLFIDNPLRERVRKIIFDAFGKYFVIDPTNIGKLRVRFADQPPSSEREEKGWEDASIKFHEKAVDVENASDGVKAFTGIITTILAGDPKVTLVDEPEAFLHPALSSKLGKEIANSLRESKKRLFASTHSSSFLMGCIQSGAPLNVVRLTYNYGPPTARLLPKEKILHLMRHPLLRSTGVLNGLFYETVVVTEGDSDRAFYQEVNERLVAAEDERGIPSCLFINAQNKQTVWEIVRPLRELGIPTAGIVDLDVIKDGGKVWTKLLDGAFLPSPSHEALHSQRQAVSKLLVESKKDMKRDGGVAILSGEGREAADNLFAQLAGYGVFAVLGGELESWLSELNVTGHGSDWLIRAFEAMGEDPGATGYVKPSKGDVWEFVGEIKAWVSNPTRKGIPAD